MLQSYKIPMRDSVRKTLREVKLNKKLKRRFQETEPLITKKLSPRQYPVCLRDDCYVAYYELIKN